MGKIKDEEGVWRTIGGRRIFIKEGQSLSEAMKSSGKFQASEKSKDSKEEKTSNDDKESKIAELEKKKEETQGIFSRGAIQEEIDMLKDDFKGTREEYRKFKEEKQKQQLEDYKKEKEARLEEERNATKKENERKYKDIKVEEVNEEDLKEPQKGYVRLYRGLNNEFDKNYDRSTIDNPNGYESWTDNPTLAKAYGKNVYYMDVPAKDVGKDVLSKDGDRYMVYEHDKKVGLKGESGKEYMMYTNHEKYFKSTYTKIVDNNSNVRDAFNKYKKEHPNTKLTMDKFKKEIYKK